RLAPPARCVQAAAGDALLRLWLPVLAVSGREAPLRAARRLRAGDLCRPRAEACDGDHRRDEERQHCWRVLPPRAWRAVAGRRRQIRTLVAALTCEHDLRANAARLSQGKPGSTLR